MRAKIYRPAKSAMTSGVANTKAWVLDMPPSAPKAIDPLMGWTSSADTQQQVRMRFATKEEAVAYAERHGVAYEVTEPKARAHTIRPKGYGQNFATERRQPWTH